MARHQRTREDYVELGRKLADIHDELQTVFIESCKTWPKSSRPETFLRRSLEQLEHAVSSFDDTFFADGLHDENARPEYPMYPGKDGDG